MAFGTGSAIAHRAVGAAVGAMSGGGGADEVPNQHLTYFFMDCKFLTFLDLLFQSIFLNSIQLQPLPCQLPPMPTLTRAS